MGKQTYLSTHLSTQVSLLFLHIFYGLTYKERWVKVTAIILILLIKKTSKENITLLKLTEGLEQESFRFWFEIIKNNVSKVYKRQKFN